MQRFVDKRMQHDMQFVFDSRLSDHLEQLIAAHPERTFVLVVSPLHESVQRAGGELAPVRKYMRELEAKFPNAVGFVYDGSTLPDYYFLDTMHLNGEGAKLFSANLRDKLRSKGIIQ